MSSASLRKIGAPGAHWCTLVHPGAHWCALVHTGAVHWCSTLVHTGAHWCTLVHTGAHWCSALVHPGATPNQLQPAAARHHRNRPQARESVFHDEAAGSLRLKILRLWQIKVFWVTAPLIQRGRGARVDLGLKALAQQSGWRQC